MEALVGVGAVVLRAVATQMTGLAASVALSVLMQLLRAVATKVTDLATVVAHTALGRVGAVALHVADLAAGKAGGAGKAAFRGRLGAVATQMAGLAAVVALASVCSLHLPLHTHTQRPMSLPRSSLVPSTHDAALTARVLISVSYLACLLLLEKWMEARGQSCVRFNEARRKNLA